MPPLREALRSDSGLTALELAIAASLMVLVLTAVYLMYDMTFRSFSDIDTSSQAQRAGGQALQTVEKHLCEIKSISHADSSMITFLGDIDDDGVLENVSIYLDPTNKQLKEAVHNTTTSTVVLSNNAVNATYNGGTDLFHYYETTTMTASFLTTHNPPADGDTLTLTNFIRVTLVTQVTSGRAVRFGPAQAFVGTTDVHLRTSLF